MKNSQENIHLKDNILIIISIYTSWVSNAKALNYTSISEKNNTEREVIKTLHNRIKCINNKNIRKIIRRWKYDC